MILYCPDCKQHKPEEDFYVDRRKKTGKSTYCKACALKRVRRSKGLPEVSLTVEEKSKIFKCAKCGQIKFPEDFYVDLKKFNGRSSYCKECTKKESAKWSKGHKELLKLQRAKYYAKKRYGIRLVKVSTKI